MQQGEFGLVWQAYKLKAKQAAVIVSSAGNRRVSDNVSVWECDRKNSESKHSSGASYLLILSSDIVMGPWHHVCLFVFFLGS